MIESLRAIRSLTLAPVFEDLYFGRDVPANLQIYLRYPREFHDASPGDLRRLTEGRFVPLVNDGNLDTVCLFDPERRSFVVKSLDEPETVVQEFDHWQQFLAAKLLEIADSGPSRAELRAIAAIVGFRRTPELLALLDELESLPDAEVDTRSAEFVQACCD